MNKLALLGGVPEKKIKHSTTIGVQEKLSYQITK